MGDSKFFIFLHCVRMTTIIIKLTFLLATSFHSIIQTVKKLVLKSGTTSSSIVAIESCIENLRGINFYVTFNESFSFFFFRHQSKRDLITGLKTRTNAGRPNWDKVFKEISAQKKGKVTVFFCGSPQLGKILKLKCDEFGFDYRKENF